MKKYNRYLFSISVIFILGLLVCVPYVKCELGAGGVMPITPNTPVNTYNSGIGITPDEDVAEQRVAIAKFIGDVRVIKKYQNKEEPARLNMPICSGDTIITGEGAKVQIVFKDGSVVTLKSNSKFTLDTALKNHKAGTYVSRMQLKVGQLRAKLKKQKTGSSFEIKTPAAVCSARGTIFYLKVFTSASGLINSLVFVEEGKVYFYDVSGQYGHIIQELGTFDASRFGTGDPNTATEEEVNAWLEDWGIGAEGALGFSGGPTEDDRNSSDDDINDLNDNNDDSNNDAENDQDSENNTQGNLTRQGTGTGQTTTTDVDSDGDGLYDLEETLIYYTDPDNPDSDGDGLNDGDEVNTYESDPNEEDSDNDGLNDGDEVNTHETDPNNADTDDDGIPDNYEIGNELNPLEDDANGDLDEDGATNLDEYTRGTQANNSDTDDDGMPDGYEISNSGLDPLVDDAEDDLDEDGLTNLEEYDYGTEVDNSDSDGDGLTDGDEVNEYETDPLSADSDSDDMPDKYEIDNNLDPLEDDAAGDLDEDGVTNLDEYLNGTDPNSEDTDSDLFKDGDEVYWGTNGALEDTDDDGALDIDDAFPNDSDLTDSRHQPREKLLTTLRDQDLRSEIEDVLDYSPDDDEDKNLLRADIEQLLENNGIRNLDDRMTRIADAQMGKVMTDIHGYRVRVEQYILRPDNKIVQILDINLRGGEAEGLAGLTVLDWTTKFNRDVSHSELQSLPWEDYLTVITDSEAHSTYYITSNADSYQQGGSEAIYPDNMRITFSHGDDSISEYTNFGSHTRSEELDNAYHQHITGYDLSINGDTMIDDMVDFVNSTTNTDGNPAGFTTDLGSTGRLYYDQSDGTLWIYEDETHRYRIDTRNFTFDSYGLTGAFHGIDDSGNLIDGSFSINSIMNVLKVGFCQLGNGSNLESIFDFMKETTTGAQSRRQDSERLNESGRWVNDNSRNTSWTDTGSTSTASTSMFSSPIDIIIVPQSDSRWRTNDITDW